MAFIALLVLLSVIVTYARVQEQRIKKYEKNDCR